MLFKNNFHTQLQLFPTMYFVRKASEILINQLGDIFPSKTTWERLKKLGNVLVSLANFYLFITQKGRSGRLIVIILSGRDHSSTYLLGTAQEGPRR